MQVFTNAMNGLNSIVWCMALVILCLGAGLWFSIRMKFPQVRLFKDMVHLLVHGEKSESGITPFQAFAATVGSRVGMGNIAGVATAIYFGGPGAVFWMWVIAFIGSGSAFIESSLAQAYKVKDKNGEYMGGPAYYIERALHCKPYAIVFAIATILGPGILMPGLHINSIASTYEEAFGANMVVVGAVFCAVLALAVCGGIKRIGKIAEYMAPVMCVIYVALALGIIITHIGQLPGVLALIVSSAWGVNPVFGGIIGSAISWGVKRGIYSNEAGQGSGAIVSAAAECSHPAKQGLVQAFSVYIDTLIVCSSSAFIILLTGSYNTVAADGETMLANNIPSVEYGIRWAQTALSTAYGGWAGKLLAIIIIMFVFTSLMGYYYQAEANVRYLVKNNKIAVWVIRIVFLVSAFSGVLVNGEIIWTMGDTGAGMMAWLNIVAILLLSKKGFALLKDYEEQKKQGYDPQFDPEKFGIEDETGVWSKQAAEYKKQDKK
ncbi:MAG: alanine:cation symporter family protein [Lachnospiraceae bacterium]|nr:alanine:cation symporter family protein [Lachnospiraceae bacterium]